MFGEAEESLRWFAVVGDGLQLLRSRRGGCKGAQKCAIKEAERAEGS